MKKLFILVTVSLIGHLCIAQSSATKTDVGHASVKTLEGKEFNTASISNDGKPFIIDFWATWCKPCVAELDAINEEYSQWKEETGVKVFAVSIDDSRSMSRVAPYVAGKGWDYTILLDPNGDFKRAMNVNSVPHTFLFDGNGKLVAQHNNYSAGDEDNLFEEIKKLSGK
ncbi:MAG: TlpA family protein disulfide reductase [Bacteroidota bacterium]|jgi:cytochrome c biogenesis protein CcmG/thiol:disulfide interchange protein DsbE